MFFHSVFNTDTWIGFNQIDYRFIWLSRKWLLNDDINWYQGENIFRSYPFAKYSSNLTLDIHITMVISLNHPYLYSISSHRSSLKPSDLLPIVFVFPFVVHVRVVLILLMLQKAPKCTRGSLRCVALVHAWPRSQLLSHHSLSCNCTRAMSGARSRAISETNLINSSDVLIYKSSASLVIQN